MLQSQCIWLKGSTTIARAIANQMQYYATSSAAAVAVRCVYLWVAYTTYIRTVEWLFWVQALFLSFFSLSLSNLHHIACICIVCTYLQSSSRVKSAPSECLFKVYSSKTIPHTSNFSVELFTLIWWKHLRAIY